MSTIGTVTSNTASTVSTGVTNKTEGKNKGNKVTGYFTEDQLKRLDEISKDKDNKKKLEGSKLGKDSFLKLMMTQLQHQDPLSPMDNKDFIAQMAQFSSVEQMANIAVNTKKSAKKTEHIEQSIASLASTLEILKDDMGLLTGRDHTEPLNEFNGNVKDTLNEVKEINQKLLNEMIKLNKAIETFS